MEYALLFITPLQRHVMVSMRRLGDWKLLVKKMGNVRVRIYLPFADLEVAMVNDYFTI